MYRSQRSTREKVCGNNGNEEDYLKYEKTFSYNISDVSLSFQISTRDKDGNHDSNLYWGAK